MKTLILEIDQSKYPYNTIKKHMEQVEEICREADIRVIFLNKDMLKFVSLIDSK